MVLAERLKRFQDIWILVKRRIGRQLFVEETLESLMKKRLNLLKDIDIYF